MLKRFFPALAAVLLAGCTGDPAGFDPSYAVRVEPDGASALKITNQDDEPVHYMIVNAEALASWAPCTSPAECPGLEPGETVRIEYAQIELYQPGSKEARLHWWQFVPEADGRYGAHRTGEMVVRL
ncbi:MAG TPA: hypothetical protein VEQ60_02480 [Longimicrobium sp.]|nr:hypothetical protein [Longimicrobium sp.]